VSRIKFLLPEELGSKEIGMSKVPGCARRAAGVLVLLLAVGTAGFAGTFDLISRVAHAPDRFGDSGAPAVSADGRYVAFVSTAPNLAPGQIDTYGSSDLFLRDRVTGTTTLITHASGSPDRAASGPSFGSVFAGAVQISADGRFVAFQSTQTDLVPGESNPGFASVYLWDRVTGATTLVSHAAGRPNTAANDNSYAAARISADGRYVVLASAATNLVSGQKLPSSGRAQENLFLWSRSSATLTLITHHAGAPSTSTDGASFNPEISADGRFVAFTSQATDLLPGQVDAPLTDDLFLYDRVSGGLSLVSHASGSPLVAAGLSRLPRLSADGRWIAFLSEADNLIAGAAGTVSDIFLYDRVTGETRPVSHAAITRQNFDSFTEELAISADGRTVAFTSLSPDVIPGQTGTNVGENAFLYDRITGATVLVSHAAGSALAGAGDSGGLSLSADGRFLAFASDATNLVAGQTEAPGFTFDVFLYDRTAGSTVLVSHTRDSFTRTGNDLSGFEVISADGGTVVFPSYATDLAGGQLEPGRFVGLFAYTRSSGEVDVLAPSDPDNPALTAAGSSTAGDLSADGRFVVFTSGAVFLRDRTAGRTTLLSRSPSSRLTAVGGSNPVISADGRVAAFLTATGDSPYYRLAVYDVAADAERFVDHVPGDPAQLDAGYVNDPPAISADGRYIAYTCRGCSLVPGQHNGHPSPPEAGDVYLYDRIADTNTLVSHAGGAPATTGDAGSINPRISADGRFVVFVSRASDLAGAGSGSSGNAAFSQVFLFDRTTGAVTLVSHAAGAAAPAAPTDGASDSAGISADGRWIFYRSLGTDLAAGQRDANNAADVFLYDRLAGTSALVSHAVSSPVTAGNGDAPTAPEVPLSISADGHWLVYLSTATNLVQRQVDRNNAPDVFLYDRVTGGNALVSHARASLTTAANQGAIRPRISADGGRIAFESAATNLVPGQAGGANPPVNLFVQDRATGARTLVSRIYPSTGGASRNGLSFFPRLSADGRRIAFTTDAALAPGDLNGFFDVYVYTQ
jgi:Tol biopolymer transport system component